MRTDAAGLCLLLMVSLGAACAHSAAHEPWQPPPYQGPSGPAPEGSVTAREVPTPLVVDRVSVQPLRGARLLLDSRTEPLGMSSDAESQALEVRYLHNELESSLLHAGAVLVTSIAEPHDLELALSFELGPAGELDAVNLRADTSEQHVALVQLTSGDRRAARRAGGIAQLLVARLNEDPGVNAFLASRLESRAPSVSPSDPGPVGPAVVDPSFLIGAPQPTAYVVAIGVEHYAGLPAPTGARLDAQRFAALASTSLGVPRTHVHMLLDQQATLGTVEKEIDWLIQSVPQGGRIYFYFSGHGAPDPSEGSAYLVPYDGDPKYLAATALPIARVMERLSRSQAREALVLLDSCFSGMGGRSVLAPGIRPLVAVKSQQTAAQVAILSAASRDEISGAAVGGQGGMFTSLLLEALGRGVADIDGNGQISLQELDDWLVPRVARAAKRDGREQTPSLAVGPALGSASGVIVEWGLPEQ